ncbi:MAG: hypothetical protein V4710_15850 [Verrucomicrobiota bacterium]
MKKRFKRITLIALLTFLAPGTGFLIYLRQGTDHLEDVRSGKLGYTAKAGWVNWGHARPESVRRFLWNLNAAHRRAAGNAFTISYSQSMSGQLAGLEITSSLARTYQVVGGLNPGELELVALGIFREVSGAFEAMQGRFPNALDARSQMSSFRNGDLMGDHIAFYRALRDYSENEIRGWLNADSVSGSLLKFNESELKPNFSWEIAPELAGGFLDELRHEPAWFASRTAFLSECIIWVRFSIPSKARLP